MSRAELARPTRGQGRERTLAITTALVLTLALQNAVPPFATDMYTPAFPRVSADLQTPASLVGLTMTTFFLGMALGQLVGGPLSDQYGRRRPMIIGGLICTLGAVGCALAPSIGWLIVFRTVQGIGGGTAAVVGRAVLVDLARGDQLARMMSIMMAIGGLAPMIAPITGGAVLTLGGTWRTVFWFLVLFGLAMMVTALLVVPESLPAERRQAGGLARFPRTVATLLRNRLFVGYMLTSAFSGFATMAYIANSSYVLQEINGLAPMAFALTFAAIALCRTLLSLLVARLVGRYRPRGLVRFGLLCSCVAVALLTVTVFALHTALVPVCLGFLILMSAQAFVYGNASALAAGQAVTVAGSASAVLGVAQAVGGATSAPLASSGGGATAVPMVIVMIVGMVLSLLSFFLVARSPVDSGDGLPNQ